MLRSIQTRRSTRLSNHRGAGWQPCLPVGVLVAAVLISGCSTATTSASPRSSAEKFGQLTHGPTVLARLWMVTNRDGWGESASGLWRTSDGGRSWREVLVLNAEPLLDQFAVLDARSMFVLLPVRGGSSNEPRIDETNDGGKRWTTRSITLPPHSGGDLQAQSLDAISTTNLYALVRPGDGMNTPDGWLLDSTDGGRNWTVLSASGSAPSGLPSAIGTIAFESRQDGWLMASSTTTSERVLYRTTDGGRRWIVDSLPRGRDGRKLVPLGVPQLFPSTHQWQLVATTGVNGVLGSTCFLFVAPEKRGPTRWSQVGTCRFVLNANGAMLSPFFLSASAGWEWSNGELRMTVDGGKRWLTLASTSGKSSLPSGTLSTLAFTDHEHGWALLQEASGKSKLVGSTDGGAVWHTVWSS